MNRITKKSFCFIFILIMAFTLTSCFSVNINLGNDYETSFPDDEISDDKIFEEYSHWNYIVIDKSEQEIVLPKGVKEISILSSRNLIEEEYNFKKIKLDNNKCKLVNDDFNMTSPSGDAIFRVAIIKLNGQKNSYKLKIPNKIKEGTLAIGYKNNN